LALAGSGAGQRCWAAENGCGIPREKVRLVARAAQGALPPLIGRRAEMLKITQILLQSRKNSLILVGESGVGKTGIWR
jgi:ATP-dependent Clp protease ATP-binding subunit ClpA